VSGSGSEDAAVTVVWASGTEPALARRLIREAIAAPGRSSPEVRLTHLCPYCGSGQHGRPLLSVPGHPVPVPFVSVSRGGGVTVVALCRQGHVGVDVEADGAADSAGFARVALHPDEHSSAGDTVLWVRKESLLKATGHGLRVEPSRLRVSAADEPPALVEWIGPGAPPVAWLYDVRTAPGHVAAVTVLAPRRPAIVVRPARGEPAPTTTA